MISSILDITRLENVCQRGGDIISACPACRENGKDSAGDNLRVFSSGKFNCIVHPKDRSHNHRILELVAVPGDTAPNPERQRAWREQRAKDRQREWEMRKLRTAAKQHRDAIISRHPWLPADVWEDSPQRIDCPLVEFDGRHFLGSLFAEDAILWAGEANHSGLKYAGHWMTSAAWQQSASLPGPLTTPATWKPGSHNRSANNVLSADYTVLDFDGFDGVKPETPEDLRKHVHASLTLVRWLREGQGWSLAAIIWTGGKSLHAWFDTPPTDVLQTLRNTAPDFGLDAGLIGHPEHACRLPGWNHPKTGRRSRVLWLKTPTA